MKLRIIVIGLATVLFLAGYVIAQENDSTNTKASESSTIQENETIVKFCPVCGPEEEMHGLAFSYKHKGRKYSFCSMGCLKAFKKNPEQFLQEEKMDKNNE